jgi:hypothetical protein
MPGSDLAASPTPADDATLCSARCCGEAACVGWVYAAHAPADFLDCVMI